MSIYRNKDILVTGGCGSIGSELVRQLLKYKPKRIRVFDNRESGHFNLKQKTESKLIRHLVGDVRDKDRLLRATEGVDIVFHAAALKHVDLCESNPFDAVLTNVLGTQNALSAAIKNRVKNFITISSDKAVNPVNTMGATKLLAEKLTINAPTGETKMKVACVRFGNVLNSDGSVIPIFKNQLANGKSFTVTSSNATRFFMTIQDAVGMILEVPLHMKSQKDFYQGGDIFVLNTMKSFKVIDLASAVSPSNPIKIIGMRSGEKLHESLFNTEELPYVRKVGRLYVIKNPEHNQPKTNTALKYTSDSVKLLSYLEITRLLKGAGIL